MFDDLFAPLDRAAPRSLAPLPGLRLRTLIPWGLLVFPLGFVVFFPIMVASIMWSNPHARLSFGATQTVAGRVVSIHQADRRNGSESDVVYAYTPASGIEYRGEACVCGDRFAGLHTADPLPVRYLVADPAVSELVDGQFDNPPPLGFFLVFALFPMLFILPLTLPRLREAIKARRLVRSGDITAGSVVYAGSRPRVVWPGLPDSQFAQVFVSFRLPDATWAEAKVRCSNPWLLQQLSPGTEVHVAYKPDRPEPAVLLEDYLR
jgi:hypothetical protein